VDDGARNVLKWFMCQLGLFTLGRAPDNLVLTQKDCAGGDAKPRQHHTREDLEGAIRGVGEKVKSSADHGEQDCAGNAVRSLPFLNRLCHHALPRQRWVEDQARH
jgi:hypothetical protein